ncbi:MAG: Rieske 2Fe-2S domain-containing protein [Planctomycetota bacterium]|jgi:cytochrome b6-f complex iron-sulfur subunit
MATKDLVVKVWIEEGCIVCDACETASPEVFEVQEETCIVRPEALEAEFTKPLTDSIADAAEECPVDVIKFETVAQEVPDAPADDVAEPVAVTAKASPDPDAAPSPPAKSPEPPAAAPIDEPAQAPAKQPQLSTAKDADPTIQALLKASTSRGGAAGMDKKAAVVPEEVALWQRVKPEELPPDIRHARALEAAARASARSKSSGKQDPSRRSMVRGLAIGAGWLAFGGAAAVTAGPAFMRFMMPNVLEEPDPRVRVGPVDKYAEMAPGDVNEDFKPQGVWMIRLEGAIAALNIICTHLGCIPNWLTNDRKFKCPCHGSGFKPTGINFEGPAPRPLERFKILEVDGQIVVDKSKKFQYELGEWSHPDSFLKV